MRLLFHAPNVHTGGGLRLMQEVLAVAPDFMDWAQLDERARNSISPTASMTVHYVRRSLLGRLLAEWRLARESKSADVILSFSGLPPLFNPGADTVVFLQNRLLVDNAGLGKHPASIRLRLYVERYWFRKIRRPGLRYIVQTTSMADLLRRCLGNDVVVSVVPFAGGRENGSTPNSKVFAEPTFDFVYVSSGEAHKNHQNLIAAWSILAEAGCKPSLALTVDFDRYPELCSQIDDVCRRAGLRIVNLGYLPEKEVSSLYLRAQALVFPSTTESFGLPLIEAAALGLPILAPELDYVRDVVVPTETFDPYSARSIARAVLRHLGRAEPVLEVRTAREFLTGIVS